MDWLDLWEWLQVALVYGAIVAGVISLKRRSQIRE
jgi:hypothetical protein